MPKTENQGSEIGEVLFEEYMLRRAARARTEIEDQIVDAVSLARDAGVGWARIGRLLEMPAKTAHHRYGPEENNARSA